MTTSPRSHLRTARICAGIQCAIVSTIGILALVYALASWLEELDQRGFLLSIATGKTRAGLARALAQYGIAHRFVASRCADAGC